MPWKLQDIMSIRLRDSLLHKKRANLVPWNGRVNLERTYVHASAKACGAKLLRDHFNLRDFYFSQILRPQSNHTRRAVCG
jgi:hypothetical protein